METAAIVVTYNRLEKLKECLDALKEQVGLDQIYVVDNSDNSKTKRFFEDNPSQNVHYMHLEKNVGNAGGQCRGLKKAYQDGYDFFWCMDDDVVPEKDSLSTLKQAHTYLEDKGEDIGFLCSQVTSISGKMMNEPIVASRSSWNKHLRESLVEISRASFVSLFFSRNVIKTVGFPIEEFFIWGEDTEFTERISSSYSCYLVGKSNVQHLRKLNELNIAKETDTQRISQYYYRFRNDMYVKRKEGLKGILYSFLKYITKMYQIIGTKKQLRKIGVLHKGYISGLLFNPQVEYPSSSQ